MKVTIRRLAGLLALGVLCAPAVAGVAASQGMSALPEGKKVTITGYVRDTACRISRDLSGAAHRECSVLCARNGVPLGIEANGAYYVAVAPGHPAASANPLLEPYAEKKVRVTGIVNEALGQRVITVTKVEPAT